MASSDLYGRGWSRSLPVTMWVLFALVALALLALIAVPSMTALGTLATGGGSTTSTGSADGIPLPNPDVTDSVATPGSTSTSPDAPVATSPGDDAATGSGALALLAEVPTVPGKSIAQYYREQFGQAWYDQDRNGCDTRNDILGRDLTDVVVKEGTNGCKVLSGTLIDPYTGERVDFVSGANTSVHVQIDHVVALAWAWRHGAESWQFEERMAFANDPANLLASAGKVNQAKSDSGPSEWLPPDEGAHCMYAEQFVGVVAEWKLGINSADRQALEDVLRACP